ncbi:MAG: hypothetical protein QGH40_01445 [bacterium]|nr:hypothetical protein [bacterium]
MVNDPVELPDNFDPYQVLGIDRTAKQIDVEAVWQEISREYAPDEFAPGPDRDEAEKILNTARRAYDLLLCQEHRSQVDQLLDLRESTRKQELVDRARVVEFCFCEGLQKRFWKFGNIRPWGMNSSFSPEQSRIYFWAHIHLSGSVDVKLEWIDPSGNVYRYMEDTVSPVDGNFYFTAWLYTHRVAKQKLYGMWKIRFLAGGLELATGEFVFNEEEQ